MDKWRVLGCAIVIASITLVVAVFAQAVRSMADILGPRDDS
jgi:hypothetical protein